MNYSSVLSLMKRGYIGSYLEERRTRDEETSGPKRRWINRDSQWFN